MLTALRLRFAAYCVIGVLVFLASVHYWLGENARHAIKQLRSSVANEQTMLRLNSVLRDAQVGLNVFFSSGHEGELASYEAAQHEIPLLKMRVLEQSQIDAGEAGKLRSIFVAAEAALAELGAKVEIQRDKRKTRYKTQWQSSSSANVADNVNGLIREHLQFESRRRERIGNEIERRTYWAFYLTVGASLITVALLVALLVSGLRLLRDRESVTAALLRQAIIDPLTGLFNRRYLDETLRKEIARALRKKTCLSLLMIDLDYFKSVNDTYGHAVGDTVLKAVADLIKVQIREGDIACRFGGEEMVLIFPDCDLSAANDRAETLRRAIAGLVLECGEHRIDSLSASFGLAQMRMDAPFAASLLHAADRALYLAKQRGRNRVVADWPAQEVSLSSRSPIYSGVVR